MFHIGETLFSLVGNFIFHCMKQNFRAMETAVVCKAFQRQMHKYNRQNEKYEFSKRKVQEETFEYSLNEVRTSLFHSVILYPFERSHIEFKQDIFTTFN